MQELALVMAGERLDAPEEQLVLLVKRAKSGDIAAFEEILGRYERQVLGTALRLLGRNLEDAKDAAQQVFLRLHRGLRQLDENRQFESWLYRVTVNVCRDMLRVRIRKPAVQLEGTEHRSYAPGADEMMVHSEQIQLIYDALDTLSERERAALVLRDLEGIATKEVARILGTREVTVRCHISSARVKIRKFVDRQSRRRL